MPANGALMATGRLGWSTRFQRKPLFMIAKFHHELERPRLWSIGYAYRPLNQAQVWLTTSGARATRTIR